MSAKYTPGPIPKDQWDAFVDCMDAADNDDLPDGAWFCVLEERAEKFLRDNRLRGCANDATHQWVRSKATGGAA